MAVGVAEPWRPATPGMELVAHYADTRPVETYADKRVFIIGKQNSGFELASGLLSWARRIVIASPSPAKLSVNTHSLVGIRARYLQPYEDHVLGGGVGVLDASIEAIERGPDGGGFVVRTRPSNGGPSDGLRDRRGDRRDRLRDPAARPPGPRRRDFRPEPAAGADAVLGERHASPGIFFAGTIGQGSKGLQKHGIPANSGAVHGARYNARCVARHIARTRFGIEPERPSIAAGDARRLRRRRAQPRTGDLEPAGVPRPRLIAFDPATGHPRRRDRTARAVRRRGRRAMPSRSPSRPTARATSTRSSTGRVDGRLSEHRLDPHPLLDYETEDARRAIESVLAGFGAGVR